MAKSDYRVSALQFFLVLFFHSSLSMCNLFFFFLFSFDM